MVSLSHQETNHEKIRDLLEAAAGGRTAHSPTGNEVCCAGPLSWFDLRGSCLSPSRPDVEVIVHGAVGDHEIINGYYHQVEVHLREHLSFAVFFDAYKLKKNIKALFASHSLLLRNHQIGALQADWSQGTLEWDPVSPTSREQRPLYQRVNTGFADDPSLESSSPSRRSIAGQPDIYLYYHSAFTVGPA